MHNSENFAESNAILKEVFEKRTAAEADAIPTDEVLALYGWNLYYLKQIPELKKLIESVSDDSFVEFPKLQIVRLRMLVQSGQLSSPATAVETFEPCAWTLIQMSY